MSELLSTDGLTRRYGPVAAVDGVDLRIPAGQRRALIGPNGAGKTTLLDLIAGASRPDGGRIHFGGWDVTRLAPARRALLGIGRTHQRPAVWTSLTALENVVVAGWRAPERRRRGWCSDPATERLAQALLERVGLARLSGTVAGWLSHGQRRQLEIAMALAGRPRLLLLDEPASGLSAGELELLRAVLSGLPRSVTLLVVEHRLDLVFALADEVTVLRDGRVVASGTPAEVAASPAARQAYVEVAAPC
jgi:branched-chain amino acid transport system ATP-binding protein